jgi:hypothetical protein
MDANPVLDPRDTRILTRRTPMDRLDRITRHCPECERDTAQDRFRIIMSSWVGFGVPLLRKRTAGKTGTRAYCSVCSECGSLIPEDAVAREWMAHRGADYLRRRN